jgi:hypothetical protein
MSDQGSRPTHKCLICGRVWDHTPAMCRDLPAHTCCGQLWLAQWRGQPTYIQVTNLLRWAHARRAARESAAGGGEEIGPTSRGK